MANLSLDGDISSSFPVLTVDDTDEGGFRDRPEFEPDEGLCQQSMVPNLNTDITESDIVLNELSGRNLQRTEPYNLSLGTIRATPLDEESGKERLFAMVFPTLYPHGTADFNCSRYRKVELTDYAYHLMRFHDGRFSRHIRWRYFIFNMIMRRKARGTAGFYVSKASNLKNLNREELADALYRDDSLLPQIVRHGSALPGTRPFWRNKCNSLQAMVRFLTPTMSPVFVTFSCADMQ
jgi:hypothetical protein